MTKIKKISKRQPKPKVKTTKTKPRPVFRTKSGHKLTPQQEMFCQLYASDREFFGNGVQSYIEAYDVNTSEKGAYNMAKAGASENLTKPYILERINEIFEAHGLNDTFVDKQLEKLIIQDADYNTKMKAIAEYNKLRQRITIKQDITSDGECVAPVALVEFVNAKREDKGRDTE